MSTEERYVSIFIDSDAIAMLEGSAVMQPSHPSG